MHDLQDLINQFENVANELKVIVFDNANLYFQQKSEEVNINNNNNKTQKVSNRLFEVI
jgi:hemerythrin-like domain-containing protein